MSELIDLVWDVMQRQIKAVEQRLDKVIVRYERAETAGGVEATTLAEAPLETDNAAAGDLLFITNARKQGEGGGAGTGTLCYFNPATNSWYRVSDDTAAAI